MSDESVDPIRLVEDADTGDRFLVYTEKDGLRIDIQYQGDTLWMTQAQIAQLFGRDQSVVSRHIRAVFEEGELEESTSMHNVHKSAGRPVAVYNLDVVISVGYRVSSKQATLFRKWATQTLVTFATKGFVVDSVRLKNPENADRIKELRDIIRDIRSDEANVFRELKQICAMCSDYEPGSSKALTFFQHTQAKLIYAVTSQTPAEVVAQRADHTKENMGLQTWPNANIRKADVTISKNYLGETEIRELNRLTTILLDIFEDQADLGRLVVMSDATNLLETQLKLFGRTVLRKGGTIKRSEADKVAEAHYRRFHERRKLERQEEADKSLKELSQSVKRTPKG